MEKLKTLYREYRDELLYKVEWPNFDQLQENTIIVLVASFLIAIVIAVMDFAFSKSLEFLYQMIQ